MNEVASKSGRKSREEWLSLMSAYEGGDLSQREFCKCREVAYSTFSYWRKQLRSPAEKSVQGSAPLLELSSFSLDNSVDWRVELDLGSGIKLRVR
jgi:hypothetical protein